MCLAAARGGATSSKNPPRVFRDADLVRILRGGERALGFCVAVASASAVPAWSSGSFFSSPGRKRRKARVKALVHTAEGTLRAGSPVHGQGRGLNGCRSKA